MQQYDVNVESTSLRADSNPEGSVHGQRERSQSPGIQELQDPQKPDRGHIHKTSSHLKPTELAAHDAHMFPSNAELTRQCSSDDLSLASRRDNHYRCTSHYHWL